MLGWWGEGGVISLEGSITELTAISIDFEQIIESILRKITIFKHKAHINKAISINFALVLDKKEIRYVRFEERTAAV